MKSHKLNYKSLTWATKCISNASIKSKTMKRNWRTFHQRAKNNPNKTKNEKKNYTQSTNVINSDVTNEFLVEKATKNDNLGLSNRNSGVTAEKPWKNQSDKSSWYKKLKNT